MAFKFYETDGTGEKCQWCRNNIGEDGDGWWWDLDQGRLTITGYCRTNVIVYISDAVDAMAFKLRWL